MPMRAAHDKFKHFELINENMKMLYLSWWFCYIRSNYPQAVDSSYKRYT